MTSENAFLGGQRQSPFYSCTSHIKTASDTDVVANYTVATQVPSSYALVHSLTYIRAQACRELPINRAHRSGGLPGRHRLNRRPLVLVHLLHHCEKRDDPVLVRSGDLCLLGASGWPACSARPDPPEINCKQSVRNIPIQDTTSNGRLPVYLTVRVFMNDKVDNQLKVQSLSFPCQGNGRVRSVTCGVKTSGRKASRPAGQRLRTAARDR